MVGVGSSRLKLSVPVQAHTDTCTCRPNHPNADGIASPQPRWHWSDEPTRPRDLTTHDQMHCLVPLQYLMHEVSVYVLRMYASSNTGYGDPAHLASPVLHSCCRLKAGHHILLLALHRCCRAACSRCSGHLKMRQAAALGSNLSDGQRCQSLQQHSTHCSIGLLYSCVVSMPSCAAHAGAVT